MDLLIRGGTVVNETGVRRAEVLIQDGKITEVGEGIPEFPGVRVMDAFGRLVLPGIIDAHTHYGMESAGGIITADDFCQGSLSAACGGVTTVIDYAEPAPGESLLEAAGKRRAEAEGSIVIDFSLHMAVPRFGKAQAAELEGLLKYGISSYKVFTTYEGLKIPEGDLRFLLQRARGLGALVTAHAEDDGVIQDAQMRLRRDGLVAPRHHAASRPAQAEVRAVKRLIRLAGECGSPIYFVHVSSGAGCRAIARARAEGAPVFGETCPHYLLLTEELYQSPEAQKYIMSPPLRREEDHRILWEGLGSGDLQVVATDHCAYDWDQKRSAGTCYDTPPGIPGSETLLPLLYSEGVARGRITLEQMVGALSANPARIFGLYPRKGALAPGSDGDVVVFDSEKETAISARHLHSAAGYTPFEGWRVKGYPVATVLRGQVVYENGRFTGGRGGGRFVPAGPGIWYLT